MVCDAIVNPTDHFYSGSGGTDLAIHDAAGKELDEACMCLPSLNTGEVSYTPSFNLPCKYVIHTVGPVWDGGHYDEPTLLRSCYINALIQAKRLGVESIAFPLISSGTFGFPKDKVLRIATSAISDFLFTLDSDIDVYICILDRHAFTLSADEALDKYIGSIMPQTPVNEARKKGSIGSFTSFEFAHADYSKSEEDFSCTLSAPVCMESSAEPMSIGAGIPDMDLADWIKKQDDTFAVTLMKLIDKKGMDDVECYKKANVTKNTFSKIRNSATYRPSKPTVLAFAIALELTVEETDELLKSAGFALSHNNLFDMIIEFYITSGIYDIFEINSALYQYDQQCLGC